MKKAIAAMRSRSNRRPPIAPPMIAPRFNFLGVLELEASARFVEPEIGSLVLLSISVELLLSMVLDTTVDVPRTVKLSVGDDCDVCCRVSVLVGSLLSVVEGVTEDDVCGVSVVWPMGAEVCPVGIVVDVAYKVENDGSKLPCACFMSINRNY